MSSPAAADDHSHLPTNDPDWRESYYFNFVDLDNKISGFSTIGLLPNISKREFIFVLFHDKHRKVYFVEPKGKIPKDLSESLSDNRLSYELIKPLKEWRIKFVSEDLTADLLWKARFPAFNFGQGSGTSWRRHFEQSGYIEGSIKLPGGTAVEIRGLGQRDKSWGRREWHIEGWFALHAQFDTFSIGLRRDVIKGESHISGGISSAQGHTTISKIDLETYFMDTDPNIPSRAVTRLYGADQSCYTIKSSMISPMSFIKFSRDFPHGITELFEEMAIHECSELGKCGTGLMEWLFTEFRK